MSANYKTGPYSVTAQVRWYGSAILNNAWNTGNLATAATRWTVPDSVYNVDPTAYLDLRASYDVTENCSSIAAIDNILDIPPQMKPGTSGRHPVERRSHPLGHAIRPAGPRNPARRPRQHVEA